MKERQRNESTSFRENNMLKSCEVLSKIHVSKIHDMPYDVRKEREYIYYAISQNNILYIRMLTSCSVGKKEKQTLLLGCCVRI